MSSPKDDTVVKQILDDASSVLVIQSDRPDGDSIASALFVEEVLATMGKVVYMYCGVAVPEYLRFIEGWDRISNELPHKVDATILVDNASMILLDKFEANPDALFVKTKPFIIADHHTEVESDITYATHNISRDNYASAGELLYTVFSEFGYSISLQAKKYVMQSILSDTMGLTNDLAGPRTYRLMADFIESGIGRSELEEARRELSKMDEKVFKYKADLIQRTELLLNGSLALCVITEAESYDVGTLYNPGPLILGELLMVRGVRVAIALKTYHNRATAAIRCTHGTNIAHALADKFGGGGHPYSAGFRIDNYDGDITNLKQQIITEVNELIQ
jgi:bifunctional oligoribonuclease and PAP phosphatase NrnA